MQTTIGMKYEGCRAILKDLVVTCTGSSCSLDILSNGVTPCKQEYVTYYSYNLKLAEPL